METDCLFIDEVSMISRKILNQIEFVCRGLKNSDKFFGGLQVVLVGDFYQLQPVRNEFYGDFGYPCFSVDWFKDAFPHVINLHIIHRQEETDLITAVNEMEQGLPSQTTVAFLNSLSRPLAPERTLNAVYLFARNIDVMLFNYNKLNSFNGDLHTFRSEDSGDSKLCDQFLAPRYFGVKIGCPVMLLINLTEHLVNGKIGTVKSIENEIIYVTFCLFGESRTVKIAKFTFSKFDPVSRTTIARRRQFPLNLAYAFTIHKSQGMTIENLVVDCSHAIYPGQIGVAIGRAQTTDGLCVKNFKPSLCRAHPTTVQKFYRECQYGEIKNDCTCCRNKKRQERKNKEDNGDDHDDDDDDDNDDGGGNDDADDKVEDDGYPCSESDLSDFEYDIIKEIENQEKMANNTEELEQVLSYILEEFEETPFHNDAVETKNEILLAPNPFIKGFQSHKSEVQNICNIVFPKEKCKFVQTDFRKFYTHFNAYISSDGFKRDTQKICDTYHSKELIYRFMTTSMFKVQKDILKEVAQREEKEIPSVLEKISQDKQLSGPGRGKIRYIGGYVIAKLKYRNSRVVKRSAFAPGKEQMMGECKRRKELLNFLCSTEADLFDNTADPESLLETKRKQNLSGSLCNISDVMFDFFQVLELKSRQLFTYEKLVATKWKFFEVVKKLLIEDLDLKNSFTVLFRDFKEKDCDHAIESSEPFCDSCKICSSLVYLYTEIMSIFIKFSMNQFRKDFLTALSVEKSKALRQKLKTREDKNKKSFNLKEVPNDTSLNKLASHLRIKSEIMRQPDILEKNCTKAQLLDLCRAYGVQIAKNKKKAEINQALVKAVLDSDSMKRPDALGMC